MFGIPDWALGVGVILLFGGAAIALMVRLLPPELRRSSMKGTRHQMLEDMQARLEELDELKQRVGELEERLDFAERVLAKQPGERRVSPPRA